MKNIFKSPYRQYAHHNNKKCEIIRRLTDEEIAGNDVENEVGDLYLIRLESGEEIQAWPEEIK